MALIDIDLDEFSTGELINELENRYLENREKDSLIDLIKDSYRTDECMKLKLFISVYGKYSVLELEEIFKETYTVTKSENQLTLPL